MEAEILYSDLKKKIIDMAADEMVAKTETERLFQAGEKTRKEVR